MRLEKLIKTLEDLKTSYGDDLEVFLHDSEFHDLQIEDVCYEEPIRLKMPEEVEVWPERITIYAS